MKSRVALILTILCAITAHASTYLDPGVVKYGMTALGSIAAIIGGILLFGLRKSYSEEIDPERWKFNEGVYELYIPRSKHKKENPIAEWQSSKYSSASAIMLSISTKVDQKHGISFLTKDDPKMFDVFKVIIK